MVNFSLEGKVALVTGASYGIGFAIATAFAKAGATIVFNDIKQELVDKGLAAYEAEGIKLTDTRRNRYSGEQRRYHQTYPDGGNDGCRIPPGDRYRLERSVYRL